GRRWPVLEGNGSDVRKIGRGRDQVIGERARQQLPVRIISEVFHEGAAQALDRGAKHLAVQGQRIDDAPDILDDEILEDLDPAGARIDGDMRGGSTVSISVLMVVLEASFGFEARGRQFGERYRAAIARGCSFVGHLDLGWRAAEAGSRCSPDLFE